MNSIPMVESIPHDGVQVRTGLPVHYIGIEATVPAAEIGQTLGEILPKVWNHLAERGVAPAAPPFSLYHEYTEEATQLEGCAPLVEPIDVEAPYVCRTLNPKQVAVAWHIGPYSSIPDTYARLSAWIAENGYSFDGAPWEVYWSDPSNTAPEEIRTEVLWPIAPAKSE